MLGRVGMVARWKPVHLGHAAVLRALVRAEQACVGIGSSNRHDEQNPFTPRETAAMIRLVVPAASNLRLVEVPDLGDGPRWRVMVAELFGPLDLFVTANAYVRDLMASVYEVVHPVHLVPEDERVAVNGTMVREAMLAGGPWRHLVPSEVADYLEREGLVSRFVSEFA